MKNISFAGRFALLFCFAALGVAPLNPRVVLTAASPSDPWEPAQAISSADFVKELQRKDEPTPRIIYVGVRTLYSGAHIPGAVFHGPGSTEQGLADLKQFVAALPKDSNIIIYCGCCPLDRCPNLRPAFSVLKELGFTRIRVLLLPTSFAADWVEKGYPVEKGS